MKKATELERALTTIGGWQFEVIDKHFKYLFDRVNTQEDVERFKSNIENYIKLELIASFFGFNKKNIDVFSIEFLQLLNDNRNDLGEKFSVDDLYNLSNAYTTYYTIHRAAPDSLSVLKDLFIESRNYSKKTKSELLTELNNVNVCIAR